MLLIILFSYVAYSQYDEEYAKVLAAYSCIAYCDTEPVQNWHCDLCKKVEPLISITQINNTKTEIVGFIGYHENRNRIIVSWRGSETLENWIDDFVFQKISYPKCKGCNIHLGFYQAYESVKNRVSLEVKKLLEKYPGAMITVTGHSLGGALSILCALQLQLEFNLVSELYSLASPRLGDMNLARFIESKLPVHYRIIKNRDIVPHLPFEFLQFHHMSYEVLYDKDMKTYKICDASGEDPTCSNRFYPQYSFADHEVYWYLTEKAIC